MEATLVLLGGGASSRMGRPKALLSVGEMTLAGWQLNRLRAAFRDSLFAGPRELAPPAVRVVPDLHPGAGPLAGIEAGLEAATTDAVFALACDLPRVTAELAERLVTLSEGHDAAAALAEGRAEPAAAAYRKSALPDLSRALEAGRLRAGAFLDSIDTAWLEGAEPGLFWNLNTQRDYQLFLSAL